MWWCGSSALCRWSVLDRMYGASHYIILDSLLNKCGCCLCGRNRIVFRRYSCSRFLDIDIRMRYFSVRSNIFIGIKFVRLMRVYIINYISLTWNKFDRNFYLVMIDYLSYNDVGLEFVIDYYYQFVFLFLHVPARDCVISSFFSFASFHQSENESVNVSANLTNVLHT